MPEEKRKPGRPRKYPRPEGWIEPVKIIDPNVEPKRIGRPPHQPTQSQRRMVEAMAGYGIPHPDIGIVIGIAHDTLVKYYPEELARGHVVANTSVARNLHQIALGSGREAVTACIFWLKCRAGWNEYAPAASTVPGKKEQQHSDAMTAEQGTGWAQLIH